MSKIKAKNNATRFEHIYRKAAILFSKKGYKTTSMKDIAEALGVEAPSLYNHIKNKNEILRAICFSMAEKFMHQIQVLDSENYSGVEKLKRQLDFHIENMFEYANELYVANHDWKQLNDNDKNNFAKIRQQYEQVFIKWIEEAKKQKDISKSIDSKIAMFTLLAALRSLEFLRKEKNSKNKIAIKKQVAQQLLKGILL